MVQYKKGLLSAQFHHHFADNMVQKIDNLIVELIKKESEDIILTTKNSLKNIKSIAVDEAWKLIQLAVASIVQIIEKIATNLEGKDKKSIALEFINSFYDRVFTIIDIPFVPSFVEPIIHRYVKLLLISMASASIDATVTIFKNTGVFLKKG